MSWYVDKYSHLCLKLFVFMYLIMVWFVALLGLGHINCVVCFDMVFFLVTCMVTSICHLVGVQPT